MTLQQVMDMFEETHHISIASIAVNSHDGKGRMIYSGLMPKTRENLGVTIADIMERFCGLKPKEMQYFVPAILFENEDGDSVETPEVVFWLWN